MIRSNLIAWLVIVLGSRMIAAEEGPKFKTVILPDAIRFVQVFSPDNKVGTLLFDNFVLGTQVGQSLPNAETKKFSYVLRPESDKEVCVVQHIRGYVSTQGSGSTAFLVHAGGKTTLVDLTKAIEAARVGDKPTHDELRKNAKKLARDSGLTVDGRHNKSDDFFVEIKSHVPLGKPLQTTFVVLVDRLTGDDGSGATLHIDSIDFEVTPVVVAKK